MYAYNNLDARAIQGFAGENTPTFFSEVRCTGSEANLAKCLKRSVGYKRCKSAGVTCEKSKSESTLLLV